MNFYSIIHSFKESKISYLSLLFALLMSVQTIGFLPTVAPSVLMGAAYLCLTYALLYKKQTELFCLIFLMLLPISILLAHPDSVFRPWARLIYFFPVFLLGSPIFLSEKFKNIRNTSFYVFIVVFSILSIISFFCYFEGTSFQAIRSEEIDEFSYQTGYFSGIARHSMMLGPLSGISSIFFLNKGLCSNKKIYFVLSIICLGSTAFSASRGAWIGTIVGLIYLIYTYSTSKIDFFKKLGLLIIFASITSPIWSPALSGIEEKGFSRREELGEFDSRTIKYNARIDEFISSPIWGVGFSSIDPNGNDSFKRDSGIVEPGSSWLGVLSMTGLLGFSLFVFLYFRSFCIVNHDNRNPLIAALLILMGIHWTIEGYIFAAGNPFCYFSWLLIGYAFDKKK